ncbi:MAG: hypothetical protein HYY85_02620 [Deltaproteobacteria bacterium]|nr:hypothetical protein [Deltaproteobacteria bacterium]
MLSWLANPESWSVILSISFPILFVSLLTWIIFSVGSAGRMRVTSENLLILLCFSSLGITVGILASSSDSSAVAPLLPAVLSLVGGIASYLVTRPAAEGTAPGDRLMVAAAVTALSLTLFIGALLGASIRQRADAYRESAAYKKYLVDVEREVDAYKRALGLKDAVADPVRKLDQVLAEIERRQQEKGQ